MTNFNTKEILEGISCETCSEERVFGSPPDNSPNNKYVYLDFSGATRCFCKKHMSYGRKGSIAMLSYKDDWDYPRYGAELISDILNNHD